MSADSDMNGREIVVGGVSTASLDVTVSENATRASHVQDAETVPWLVRPLKQGLDVTYGKVSSTAADRNERVAILKLTGGTETNNDYAKDEVTQWAIYSFKYKSDGKNALWYDNGEHYFEGLFVPNELRYGPGVESSAGVADENRQSLTSVNTISAPDITTDQTKMKDDIANYTLLEHYLAMPANTNIHATVGRVKLPFYHRLSRVIAYILIDPDMSPDPEHPVTLKGYKIDVDGKTTSTDDPTTTSLRFCNVDVLEGVEDTKDAQLNTHVLTPHWGPKRKVIPHFMGEEGSVVNTNQGLETKDENFIMFYDDTKQDYIFPTMEAWATWYSKTDAELSAATVTKTVYGKVPVYDLIVRPTYTAKTKVMYDERNAEGQELTDTQREALVTYKNKINFELELSNGLIYTKEYEFDLDANQQTIVYLRISRESIDYNASGSELWIDKESHDDWYGVDNKGGHSLSKVGSSWQRAYTYSEEVSGDKVTDGGFYNENTTGEDGTEGQYVTEDTWIKHFLQAYEGGANHGDYFTLTTDITIDAKLIPRNFVFTGHLDGRGHTIKLENCDVEWSEDVYQVASDYNGELYVKNDGGEYEKWTLPDLYEEDEENEGQYIKVENPSLSDAKASKYYARSGDFYELYTQPELYKKQVKWYLNAHQLFSGLNGAYIAEDGQANVHTEGGKLVPYTDGTTGWRAEVINLNVDGLLFPEEVYTISEGKRTGYITDPKRHVSGNVQNCYDKAGSETTRTKVPDHTPALFKY